jgi:hypothetical protein
MRRLERVEQRISFAAAAVVGVVRVYPLQVLRGGVFLQVFAVDDGSDGGSVLEGIWTTIGLVPDIWREGRFRF